MASGNDQPSPSPSNSSDGEDDSNMTGNQDDRNNGDSTSQGGENGNNNQDAPRQKRKKARRACLACQRAHLTCSDERPCQRCIKRGLSQSCHDGLRKKAKYLHDTPNEALMPGIIDDSKTNSDQKKSTNGSQTTVAAQGNGFQQGGFFPPGQPGSFGPQQQMADQTGAPTPMHDNASFSQYNNPQGPIPPQFDAQQQSPMQNMAGMVRPTPNDPTSTQGFGSQMFDPNDPNIFGFDTTGMNFGNHYGALEFGMLDHMSSIANNPAMFPGQGRSSSATTYESSTFNPSGYSEPPSGSMELSPPNRNLPMNTYPVGDFDPQFNQVNHHGPPAYSIVAGGGGYQAGSPSSTRSDMMSHDTPYTDVSQGVSSHPQLPQRESKRQQSKRQSAKQDPNEKPPNAAVSKKLSSISSTRTDTEQPRTHPSSIYASVTKPYPYTAGFHALFAVLQRRFSSQKRLSIARALASIRPSFIACTKSLVDEDLLFMEKTFQRALWEYEDFVGAVGTPTIICRRTGEVAYAGLEFTLMSGWSQKVLLGQAPNLNVNRSYSAEAPSGSLSGTSSAPGFNTPRLPPRAEDGNPASPSGRTQPVFLAELLDDDSVVQFYEDFARLAFADSKGSAWSPCKVLKYKTKEDMLLGLWGEGGSGERGSGADDGGKDARDDGKKGDGGGAVQRGWTKGRNPIISDQLSTRKLGDKEGKVDCMYCWTVRRDLHNMPFMLVVNFLPIL